MFFLRPFAKILSFLMLLFFWGALTCGASYVDPEKYGSPKGEVCVTCHRESSPGIYSQWKESAHGQVGVNCYDCHRAEPTDPDVFEHKEMISIVVTPKDCSRCHEKEYKDFSSSYHAEAVSVLESDDNFFGRAVWGDKEAATGCISCHGSSLVVLAEGKLSPATWPNSGIGRINPDKSKGSCTACHGRHLFSKEQARRPESCGKCHTGTNQPQIEIYTRSKHGAMYATYNNRMNMQKSLWQAGLDYYQAPTCSTCHMSAIPPQMEIKTADERIRSALESVLSKDQELLTALLPPTEPTKIDFGATHNVSSRLSWKLAQENSAHRENWQENRKQMQSVCLQCHGEHFVAQHYAQFDDLVELYNKTVGFPSTKIRAELIQDGNLTKENFDDKLDLIYWSIWNDGGRRALNGAAMTSPSYMWTNGMQKVVEHYQMEFIPEVRNLYGRGVDSFLKKHGYTPPRYKP